MSKYHDDRTRASDPVHVRIADEKLRELHPELYGWKTWISPLTFQGQRVSARQLRAMLNEHVQLGDSRAAVVVQLSPLIVAAYTDEQDAVLLLRFPDDLVGKYRLKQYARLLTVNTYFPGQAMAPDLIEGPESTGRWKNFYPIIAEFVSNDGDAIERRKGTIVLAEWERTKALARFSLTRPKVLIRDGRPLRSWNPAGRA